MIKIGETAATLTQGLVKKRGTLRIAGITRFGNSYLFEYGVWIHTDYFGVDGEPRERLLDNTTNPRLWLNTHHFAELKINWQFNPVNGLTDAEDIEKVLNSI